MQPYREPIERPLGRPLSRHRSSASRTLGEAIFGALLVLVGAGVAASLATSFSVSALFGGVFVLFGAAMVARALRDRSRALTLHDDGLALVERGRRTVVYFEDVTSLDSVIAAETVIVNGVVTSSVDVHTLRLRSGETVVLRCAFDDNGLVHERLRALVVRATGDRGVGA
ncbi:MAG: hypothetical protein HYV09_06360 [Deltaproteobacteria bacterium]|nr:hypothetical protein [Deltaproteobacteria bacterium]